MLVDTKHSELWKIRFAVVTSHGQYEQSSVIALSTVKKASSLLCFLQLVRQECEGLGRRHQSLRQHFLRPSGPGDEQNPVCFYTPFPGEKTRPL